MASPTRSGLIAAIAACIIATAGCTGDGQTPPGPPTYERHVSTAIAADLRALRDSPQAASAQTAITAATGVESDLGDESISHDGTTFAAVSVGGQTLGANPSTVIVEMYPSRSGPNPVEWTTSELGPSNGTWTIHVNGVAVDTIHYQIASVNGPIAVSLIAGTSGDFEFRVLAYNADQNEADRVSATVYAHFAA